MTVEAFAELNGGVAPVALRGCLLNLHQRLAHFSTSFKGIPGGLHLAFELVLPLRVGMGFYGMVPRVDVPLAAAVVG